MFYFPNVLRRHTGCFSTIWLAATKGSRIIRREYLQVDVIQTCQMIVQYILQQVPPPYLGSPIPRLSLYLSAQLSYGVVCVYHRQCDLLIEEMKTTLDRLNKADKQTKIDLLQNEQHWLVQNDLMLMQMHEDAPNPFFGMMEIPPELLEPAMIPQISMLLETSGPEIVRLEKSPPRRRRASHREDTSHLASPEIITMQEMEPAPLPSIEFGQDLPEVSALDLEFLLSDLPALPEVETLPKPRKRRIPEESDTREHPKDAKDTKTVRPKEPDADRESIRGMEDTAIEAERTELHNMEKEVERLKEEKRQSELQREIERARERREEIERAKRYRQEAEREMERLRKAIRELKRLQITGATQELVREKQKQIKQLKKFLKEKQRQWKAEKLEQQLRDEERERERLKELERMSQRLREAEQEIERLKKAMAEKELEQEGMEPDKKIRKTEDHVEEKRRSETEGSPVRSSPKSGLPSEMLSEPDAAALLEDVTEQPMEFFPEDAAEIQPPVPAPPRVSPPPSSPQLMLPEVPLEAGLLPPVRRRVRRRKPLQIDKKTQIGSKVMQERTTNPLIYTRPPVPAKIPPKISTTVASLLDTPTYKQFMAPELRELWSRCAILKPLQYIKKREEEFVSELEEVRAGTESGVSMALSSEISLEVSEEERSRLTLLTPEDRRSLSGQEDRFLPIVSEMPELIVELPETEEVLLSDIQRNLHSEIDSSGHSEFHTLAPRSLSRLLVSRFFFSCLELSTQQVICLEQTEPYGRIVITPGRQYSQG